MPSLATRSSRSESIATAAELSVAALHAESDLRRPSFAARQHHALGRDDVDHEAGEGGVDRRQPVNGAERGAGAHQRQQVAALARALRNAAMKQHLVEAHLENRLD